MNEQVETRSYTLRQRVLDALHFNETEALPYTLPIDPELTDRLDVFFRSDSWRRQIHDHVAVLRLPALGASPNGKKSYRDPFGSLWRTERGISHLEKPALEEPDLRKYHWPALDRLWDQEAVAAQVEAARQKGQFLVASTGFGLFERSWTLRGYENALADMLLHPDFYEELLERILEILLGLVDRFSALPLEGILLSDDWGGQKGVIMGPKLWRKYIQPRARRFFEAVHHSGKWTFQHCCGNVFEIIPEMIESGLDVLESLQPEAMDVYEIKRRYGKDLRLWGGLGTQRMLPFGSPEEIRLEIQKLRRELGRGGGYILAPAKPLMPDVPLENAAAAIEEFIQVKLGESTGS